MNSSSQRFRNTLTASTAFDARAAWVFLNLFAASFCALVRQEIKEHTQRGIMSRQGKFATQHERKVQVFSVNDAVIVGKLPGCFVPEVLALIGDLFVKFGDSVGCFTPVGTAFLLSRESPVEDAQFLEVVSEPTWIVELNPITQGQQRTDTDIDTNVSSGVAWWLNVWKMQLEVDGPLTEIALNNDLPEFCTLWNRAVQVHAYLTDTVDVEAIAAQLATVAVPVCHRLESFSVLEARNTANPFVKRTVRFVQAAQHLLHCSCTQLAYFIWQLVAQFLEPLPLLIVGRAQARPLPTPPALCECVVVDIAHLPQHEIKLLVLCSVWVEAVLVRAKHLASFLSVDVTLNCLARNTASSAAEIGTSPEARESAFQPRKFFSEPMSGIAFDSVHDLVRRNCWWKTTKEMNMIRLYGDVENITANLGYLVTNKLLGSNADLTSKHVTPKFRTPHKVVVDVIRSVSRSCVTHKLMIAHLFYKGKNALPRTLIPLPAEAGSTLRG